MFKHQITLLTQLIKDWEEDTLESYDWDLTKGLCTNCELGFDTLVYKMNYTYQDAKIFLTNMYQNFPEYTGEVYYPICTKEEYFPTSQQAAFVFKTDKRLALAKHCLQYLQSFKGN